MSDTQIEPMAGSEPAWARAYIAFGILTASVVGVLVLSGIVLINSDSSKIDETSKYVFSTILPLLGTWVGTVLAFYFSKENFEAANRSVREMAETLSPAERLRKLLAKDSMRLLKDMTIESLPSAGSGALRIKTILGKMSQPGAEIKRLPVLDGNNVVKYIIHRSELDGYLASNPGQDTDKLTLQDLFSNDPGREKLFSELFCVVAPDDSLAEAKAKMETLKGCQDVFVTSDGKRTSPVVGWLTNNKISELARA